MTSQLQEAFHAGYIASRDERIRTLPPAKCGMRSSLENSTGQQPVSMSPSTKAAGDTYKGLRSGEVFRFSYDPLRIEAVQEARVERSGRSR